MRKYKETKVKRSHCFLFDSSKLMKGIKPFVHILPGEMLNLGQLGSNVGLIMFE